MERAMKSLAADRRGLDRASHPAAVHAVDPGDGASQVLCDAPIVLHLSAPIDPSSLSAQTVHVQDSGGPLAGWLKISPDGHVVIWGGARPFRAGALHFVVVRGLRDTLGRPVPSHFSSFVPCDLTRDDLRI
jgi:hypothetical protein